MLPQATLLSICQFMDPHWMLSALLIFPWKIIHICYNSLFLNDTVVVILVDKQKNKRA